MRSGAFWLACLLALLLAGAAGLTWQAVEEIQTPAANVTEKADVEASHAAAAPRIVAPLAVLILDVSSSMTSNDRTFQQAAAARFFLDAYRVLVAEALGRGEGPARAAVIVFGSSAQVVQWPAEASEDGGRFLVIPRDAATLNRLIDAHLVPYLGSKRPDPRSGLGTDFGAAVATAAALVERAGAVDAPCIAFMTDGNDNPFFALTPTLPRAERERWFTGFAQRLAANAGGDSDRVRGAIDGLRRACAEDPPGLLAPPATPWDPVLVFVRSLQRDDGTGVDIPWKDVQETAALVRDHREGLARLIDEIRLRSYRPGGPPTSWLTIVLNPDGTIRAADVPLPDAQVCASAEQLQALFVEALARWMGIVAHAVTGSAFDVPSDTHAFAVVAKGSDVGDVALVAPGGASVEMVRTAGAGGLAVYDALVASPREGVWRIRAAQELADVQVWMRRRFEWVLARPVEYSLVHGETRALLGVVDSQDGSWADPARLGLSSPHPTLSGGLERVGGGPLRALTFRYVRSDASRPLTYEAVLPPARELSQGTYLVWCEHPSAGAGGLPVGSRVEARMAVVAAVRFGFEDGSGKSLRGVRLEHASRGAAMPGGGSR